MCDGRYYDTDIDEECCPSQPMCAKCWSNRRAELRKETDMEIKTHIEYLQARGLFPKFDAPKKLPVHDVPAPVDKPQGSIYEFTATLPEGMDDPYLLRGTLNKLVNSRMYEVIKWKACIELTKKGTPHMHAIIYSKKDYCDGSKIKGKPINFPYIYTFKRVRSEDDYLIYIAKENGKQDIADYCIKKGIPQFWESQVDNFKPTPNINKDGYD